MQLRIALALFVLFGTIPLAQACSICAVGLGQAATLREKVAEAKAVVRGDLKNAKLDPQSTTGTTEFHFTNVLKSHDTTAKQTMIVLPKYYPIIGNTSPDYVLFFDVNGLSLDAFAGQSCTAPLAKYLEGIAKLDARDALARLAFYFQQLDATDAAVADDAFLEFVKTTDAELTAAKHLFDARKLRQWVRNPKLPPEKLGVFALLLGQSGTGEDLPLFVELVKAGCTETGAASLAGVLAGQTLLDAKTGWASLKAILNEPKNSYPIRLSALTALHYLQANHAKTMKPELLNMYRVLLASDLADLAISDLRRFQWWDLSEDVLKLYAKPMQSKLMRRLILRYALTSPGVSSSKFIAEVRRAEPQAVQDAEEYLRDIEARPPKQ